MHSKIARGVAVALAAGSLAALTAPGTAGAAGFSLPEVSTAGLGMSNAMVANPVATGAFAYNPAAMGFHDASSVALGGVVIGPSFNVDNATGSHDSQGADWLAGPMLQAAIKLDDRWRVGLGVNAPFGLETRWDYGTFPALAQSRAIAPGVQVPTGNSPTQSKLGVIDFVPSVAYKLNENLSLSLGADLYWAKYAELDSNLGMLRGSGSGGGVGVNLGVLYRIDAFSVGAAYKSGATLGIDGMYTPLNNTLVALNSRLTAIGSRGLQPAQTASVDVDLPWSFQLGARYQLNDALAVELDWTYTGWSRFEELNVVGDQKGALIFSDVNDWSDSNAYRLGVSYKVRPETELRFGYSYDETGQGDEYFSARVPDSDRQLFSIGVAQGLGNGYSIEAGYMYVMADERDFSASRAYVPGGPVNGTSALDGSYAMDAHLLALELVKTF